MPVTEADIEAARSARGGWTKKAFAHWGIAWPPAKGWKQVVLADPTLTPYIEPPHPPVTSVDDLCGFKRNPHSSRPPCNRLDGHEGTHSYRTDRLAGI